MISRFAQVLFKILFKYYCSLGDYLDASGNQGMGARCPGNVCRGEKKGGYLCQLLDIRSAQLCNFSGQVVIPPELGYGDTGAPPDIPPNAVLVFELDLIKIDQRAEL